MAEALTYQEYQDAKEALKMPGLSPEDIVTLQQGVDAYDANLIGGQAGMGAAPAGDDSPITGVIDEQGNAYGPGGNAVSPSSLAAPSGPQVSDLDPNLPPWPQALAAESPVGGPAAQMEDPKEWFYSPESKKPGSTTIFYEPPLEQVKQRLMENPQLIKTMLPDQAQFITPETIANLTEEDGLYTSVADDDWRKAKTKADETGTAAYRYSRHEWLQGHQGLSFMDMLGLKLKAGFEPAMGAIGSAVLGYDEAANFGLGRMTVEGGAQADAQESLEKAEELGAIEPELAASARSHAKRSSGRALDDIAAEHPYARRVGQALGIVNPKSGSNVLYDFVASGGQALAPHAGWLGRSVLSGLGGLAGGAATQATEEGVRAIGRASRGEVPEDPSEALGRIGNVSALSGGLGTLFEGVGSLLGHTGDRLAAGTAYREVPDRLQRHGGGLDIIEGAKLSPQTEALLERARELDVGGVDLLARDLSPQIAKAAKAEVDDALKIVEKQQQDFYASDEGKLPLPATNTVEAAYGVLKLKHDPVASGAMTENVPSAVKEKVQALFNDQIYAVSAQPVEGAIAMPVADAQAYLSSFHQNNLAAEVEGLGKNTGAREAPPQPYAPEARGGVETRPAVDRTLLPQHGPEREARPGVGPDKRIPRQPFNDTRGELARAGETRVLEQRSVMPEHGPAREAAPGMGLEGRAVPDQPFRDTRDPGAGPAERLPQRSVEGQAASGPEARPGVGPDFNQPPISPDPRPQTVNGPPRRNADRDHVDGGDAQPVIKRAIKPITGAGIAYAATSENEGDQAAAAGAGALLGLLKGRGIDTVYVIPKRTTAAHHDQAIRDIKGWQDGMKKVPRELVKLDEAARVDRDQRKFAGRESGWSAMQNEHEKLIADAKNVDILVNQGSGADDPDGAYRSLLAHSKQQDGEIPRKEAIERAADRAGVRPDVNTLRLLDPMMALRDAASPLGGRNVQGQPRSFFSPSRVIDPVAIRSIPALRAAGADSSMLRGGRAGAAARLAPLSTDEPDGPPDDIRGLPVNDPRVQAWLRRKKEARP